MLRAHALYKCAFHRRFVQITSILCPSMVLKMRGHFFVFNTKITERWIKRLKMGAEAAPVRALWELKPPTEFWISFIYIGCIYIY